MQFIHTDTSRNPLHLHLHESPSLLFPACPPAGTNTNEQPCCAPHAATLLPHTVNFPIFFFGATTSSLCQRDKCADVCPLSATPLQLRHSKTQRTEPKLHIGMNVCISARVTARPAVNNEHGIRLTHTRSLLTHTRSLLTHTRSLLTMQMHAHASR
jgi:hypothetical protein